MRSRRWRRRLISGLARCRPYYSLPLSIRPCGKTKYKGCGARRQTYSLFQLHLRLISVILYGRPCWEGVQATVGVPLLLKHTQTNTDPRNCISNQQANQIVRFYLVRDPKEIMAGSSLKGKFNTGFSPSAVGNIPTVS